MFPGENDFIVRNDFAVFALDPLLLAVGIYHFPTELSAYSLQRLTRMSEPKPDQTILSIELDPSMRRTPECVAR